VGALGNLPRHPRHRLPRLNHGAGVGLQSPPRAGSRDPHALTPLPCSRPGHSIQQSVQGRSIPDRRFDFAGSNPKHMTPLLGRSRTPLLGRSGSTLSRAAWRYRVLVLGVAPKPTGVLVRMGTGLGSPVGALLGLDGLLRRLRWALPGHTYVRSAQVGPVCGTVRGRCGDAARWPRRGAACCGGHASGPGSDYTVMVGHSIWPPSWVTRQQIRM